MLDVAMLHTLHVLKGLAVEQLIVFKGMPHRIHTGGITRVSTRCAPVVAETVVQTRLCVEQQQIVVADFPASGTLPSALGKKVGAQVRLIPVKRHHGHMQQHLGIEIVGILPRAAQRVIGRLQTDCISVYTI